MKYIPASIAGRARLVLILGLILVLLLSGISLGISFSHSPKPNHFTLPSAVQTMAGYYAALDTATRQSLNQSQPQYHWRKQKPAYTAIDDWHSRNLRKHIATRGNIRQVEIGYVGDIDNRLIAVQLADESWLSWNLPKTRSPIGGIISLLTVLLVLGSGIVILASVVTKKIVQPLQVIAQASERFGMDINAPHLCEEGPLETRQVAKAFNDMQQRIRRFVQERTQMIAAISHDLRTPLTRLRLRTEYIEDADQRNKAIRDLEEMDQMVRSSLNFAKLNTSEELSQKHNITGLVTETVEDYRELNEPVTLQPAEPVYINCKPNYLKRSLCNLIDNALRYGEQAKVAIKQCSDSVEIQIRDRGPGIPEHQLEQIFLPFYRLEKSRSRHTGGSGLGLAIALSGIQNQGGNITVSNMTEGGACFIIHLPLSI